jgi:2-polyprenyl-6-methoxyphenol hydroxylase-like FAD-dependent oxidoreductase
MTSEVIETPVLIVGGGPAGLTASLLLSRHGVDSLLIDKRLGASPLPRARGVHSRAMEILRVCGVEPDLRAVELPTAAPTPTGPVPTTRRAPRPAAAPRTCG